MAKGPGNTIIVAGGGGAGGGSRGGGSSNGGGDNSSKPKGGSKDKLKIDDNMFNTAMMALIGVGAFAYIYYSRPDLVNEFIGTFTGNKNPQVPAVPASPQGTVQNDTLPQAPGETLPYGGQGGMMQPQQEMNYPSYPQQSTGMDPFSFPQQSPNVQQYQPYQPSQYGGGGAGAADITTSFNPAFGQNSNQPTYSFAARRATKLDYDSEDGMITRV